METEREDGAQEAINRVLAAEREAAEAVRRCEQQAAALREETHTKARRLAERTDARIRRLRTRIEEQTAQQVAVLRVSAEELRSRPVLEDARRARLPQVVARLAARLTGETP